VAIRVVGSRFSSESQQVREFLARTRIPHDWLDPDHDDAVEDLLREVGVTPAELPIVIVSGSVLRRPTSGALSEYLGLTGGNLPDRFFDLVIVGGGPAGLAAAVYGASEGLQTLNLDMVAPGGQAGTSSRIENYLGFPTGISGSELTQRALVQAEKFGAHLTAPRGATSLREQAGHLVVGLSDGTEIAGRAVIVATGARYRRLDVDRLVDFEGKGVYYAATTIEARECDGSPVIVVGGGNSEGQAAVLLAESGSPVTVIIRGPDLNASMSRYLVDRLDAHELIDLRANARIVGLDGRRDAHLGPCCRRKRRCHARLRRAVLVHRGRAGFGVVVGMRCTRRTQLRAHWPVAERGAPRWAMGRVGTAAASIRDESSRSLRRRRRPSRPDQTGGCSRWRRIGGGAIRP
jgi:thioredoxin reductase (NADPH)